MAEVIFSLVLLALFAALAFGLLQSSHRAMSRGNKRVDVNHVTQTAVEHFKASIRMYAAPVGDCPIGWGGTGVGTRYCRRVTNDYWAIYDYDTYVIEVPEGGSGTNVGEKLLLVELAIYDVDDGAPGTRVGSFSFLTFEGGY